jgi:hypothetical protein
LPEERLRLVRFGEAVMQRRRFLFWVSLGVFQVGELLRLDSLDRLAAAVITSGEGPESRPYGEEPLPEGNGDEAPAVEEEVDEGEPGEPDAKRRARDGRPPSKWLRRLKAEELRIWLPTIEPPEAGVQGMTFWIHLTRDHSFDAEKIKGLTIPEQAKLHAAAHDGY